MVMIAGDLVGHSMAGFALAQIMERFPHKINLAVFMSAVLSGSGLSLNDDAPLFGIVRFSQIHPPITTF